MCWMFLFLAVNVRALHNAGCIYALECFFGVRRGADTPEKTDPWDYIYLYSAWLVASLRGYYMLHFFFSIRFVPMPSLGGLRHALMLVLSPPNPDPDAHSTPTLAPDPLSTRDCPPSCMLAASFFFWGGGVTFFFLLL